MAQWPMPKSNPTSVESMDVIPIGPSRADPPEEPYRRANRRRRPDLRAGRDRLPADIQHLVELFALADDPDDGIDDVGIGGWVPPDRRDWRHPSEAFTSPRAGGGSGGSAPGGPGGGSGGHHGGFGWGNGGSGGGREGGGPWGHASSASGPPHHRALATAAVAAGALTAVLLGVLVLFAAGGGAGLVGIEDHGGSTAPATLLEVTGCCRDVPRPVQEIRQATVALDVATSHGLEHDCGVAIAPDGIILTTRDAVDGARSITAITATGRHVSARVLATDEASDVAVVQVRDDVPTAHFADDTSLLPGYTATVVAIRPSHARRRTTTMWVAARIRSVGTAVPHGDAEGMAAIRTTPVPMPAMAGEVLVGSDGSVIGVLDTTAEPAGAGGGDVFLPATFALDVARTIATSGTVRHGWLGVVGVTASPGPASGGSRRTTDRPSRSPGSSGRPTKPSSATRPTTITTATTTTTTTAVSHRRTRSGALVEKIDPGAPAQGILQPGDLIVSVDGQPVRSWAELRSRLYLVQPGQTVLLGIWRGGSTSTVAVVLSASP